MENKTFKMRELDGKRITVYKIKTVSVNGTEKIVLRVGVHDTDGMSFGDLFASQDGVKWAREYLSVNTNDDLKKEPVKFKIDYYCRELDDGRLFKKYYWNKI